MSQVVQLATLTSTLAALHVPQATVVALPHEVQTPAGVAVEPAPDRN